MISVAPCSRDTFPLGIAGDKYVQTLSHNYLMLTYNGKQSKTKEASLLTFSLTKLLRIAVFNLEILTERIKKLDKLLEKVVFREDTTQYSSDPLGIPYTE